ncbi:hypothetical protein MYCTH_2312876 [Thermothelomyces thermophilus ATCC 42464]|uniref:Uncharacterized protein n=1 Tax=Thermothelomyces thermophilus (strain ATCC 42464 / BCRC 31852 / DSM 1799) TaxID=573729 RepID=G2QNC8_THET4|nr:uncharacterized protein MYCTH_2312876 [Thermothelomyces thermophilus ATCC 42464]AEO62001.1 hypothetical protein MYCTH_2312876 [Thermothelomyces thermophilus ATCC 42464]
MADRGGRRPVYALMFALAVGANVGIALVRRWAGLLVLRMMQSAGSSGEFFFPFLVLIPWLTSLFDSLMMMMMVVVVVMMISYRAGPSVDTSSWGCPVHGDDKMN